MHFTKCTVTIDNRITNLEKIQKLRENKLIVRIDYICFVINMNYSLYDAAAT